MWYTIGPSADGGRVKMVFADQFVVEMNLADATKFGQSVMDKARYMCSCAADDPRAISAESGPSGTQPLMPTPLASNLVP